MVRKGPSKNKNFGQRESPGRGSKFGPRRDDSRSRFRSRDDRPRRQSRDERFTGICASCGAKCEVPFKPRLGKPIYCNECFSGSDSKGAKNPGVERRLEEIEKKIDRILNAMNLN